MKLKALSILSMIAMVEAALRTVNSSDPFIIPAKYIPTNIPTNLVLFGYFTNWNVYGSPNANYQPSQIPSELTGVFYAFAQVNNCAYPYSADKCATGPFATGVKDGKVYATDPYSDFNTVPRGEGYKLEGEKGLGNMGKVINKMHSQNKPAILSIGGYTLSPAVERAMTEEERLTFVNSAAHFLDVVAKDNGGATFDGIDIDIEPDNAQWRFLDESGAKEKLQNILATATLMRQTMHAKYGPNFRLTAAWPASPAIIKKADAVMPGFWQAWLKELSNVNLMNYDYHGDFDSSRITNFNAPQKYDPAQPENVSNRLDFNVESTLDAYRSVLKEGETQKLNIGLPLYGRGLAGVPKGEGVCPGVYQPFTSAWTPAAHTDGMFSNDAIQGYIESGKLTPCYYEPTNQWTAYGEDNGKNVWVSYDTPESVKKKLDLISKYKLGGGFYWELAYEKKGESAKAAAQYLYLNPHGGSSSNSSSSLPTQHYRSETNALIAIIVIASVAILGCIAGVTRFSVPDNISEGLFGRRSKRGSLSIQLSEGSQLSSSLLEDSDEEEDKDKKTLDV